MSVTITRDEWLSEFERVMRQQPTGDPGLSTVELSGLLHVGPHRVNALLREAFRSGRLKVGRKPSAALDGRRCMVPCYQLKPAVPNRRKMTRTTDIRQHAKAAKRR